MESAEETIVTAFHAAPIAMEVLRMADPDDLGSFYPVAVNDTACAVLGQNIKADIGKTWNETSPELARSDFATMFKSVIDTGEPASWEVKYGDRRFETNWWRGTATKLDDRTIVIVFENVSQEVENRSELERSNRALDDFAYVASHDLKAPLRDIDNLAKWIAEDLVDLPDKTARHLATLRQRIDRMEALLGDLLQYSRAGRIYGQPERFRLAESLRTVEALLPHREGIELVFPENDVDMDTPRAPFELVLRNLVANAIKHHDGERGRVDVSVEPEDERVVITVRDDGPGIAPEYHERIFGMFQTLKPRDAVEGTGMGLALCRKLVEAHGDSLTVESAAGEGSAFTFGWPRHWNVTHDDEEQGEP